MKLLFWLCASLMIFVYAGYPIYLYFRARFCLGQFNVGDFLPRRRTAIENMHPRSVRRLSLFTFGFRMFSLTRGGASDTFNFYSIVTVRQIS
jgi:hypothetical protein